MKVKTRNLTSGIIFACLTIASLVRAETVVWSENFDGGNGNNRWYADNGVWQIGSPTIGPETNSVGYRTHSGPYCATTGLTANYPSGANSRLIRIQKFTVPPADQFPRLRFWQWYNFANSYYGGQNDYGVVEVKGTNGLWQEVSPRYYNSGGDWTYASIDLSAFAGQTVQLAFHMVQLSASTAPGWYIDDISLVTGTPVFNNPESWENGIGDWYAETGTWQVGVPTSGPGAAHGGTNCAATILNGNYPSAADSRLVSPRFVVPPASTSPALRFWQWYSFANSYYGGGNDYGIVEIKAGTNAWAALSPQYTGNSGAWIYPYLDLTAYGGQKVRLAFHMVQLSASTASGWYVDDIGIISSGAPQVITPPTSKTNTVGTTATFNVSASGDQPLSYQWRYNSNPIPDATNAALILTNVQLSQAGDYDVVITNDAGSITSTPPAQLSVIINFTGVAVDDPTETGSFTNSGGTYTVQGSGEGTDGTADIFYYLYQALNGDAQIVARLKSMNGGDPNLAEAGVMIRQSLDPGSKQVSLSLNESTNVIFRRRLTDDDFAIQSDFDGTNYFQGTNYIWLRLMRMGDTFIAYDSTNGVNWHYEWFTTVNMSNQVQVGLEVTAHHYGETNTATFDDVSIGSLTPLSGTLPLPGPELLTGGEQWSPAEFQRVGGFEFLLTGVVGDYFSLESSSNLATPFALWSRVGDVTNTYGVVPFLDVQAPTNTLRFYRAQRLGP